MTVPSPWLDVHRSSRPPRSDAAESDEETDESEAKSETETESADGNTASKTNPWDDIESSRRPSQSAVDLPSPDQPAGD